jgi:NAD(P)H-dependent FMN reductase
MADKDKDTRKEAVSLERRELLKAGVAMAAAPVVAGVGAMASPSEAQAAPDKKRKSVLLISASPRTDSNSEALGDEFLRGAREAGHQVEKIRLTDRTVNYCTGCLACISEPGFCSQQDDMTQINEKMLAADVLVLATPVYFHAMNGRMKVFIDRVCPIYTLLHEKDFYYAVSCAGGGSQVESSVESLKVFTRSFYDCREKGVMSVTGSWDGGKVPGSRAGKKAFEMGRNA